VSAIIIRLEDHRPVVIEDAEIDLMTAVDAAIRDLRDITRDWGSQQAFEQAELCRAMLTDAYQRAVQYPG